MSTAVLIGQPPADRQRLPTEAWEPLMLVVRYVSWIGIVACIAALVTFGAMLAYQRVTTSHILEDKTLFRICGCAVLVGSAAAIANRLIV
ncbi:MULTISPECIES: hypothetical protein [Rhodococcus]|uniref:hypothetical protein n=1 Tax=Rhodococcus TaxID=1827 RepID=UPI0013A5BDC6|nr:MULTISPECIES: hypothetical protein [Rhodococcus]QTJ71250.1 hypothetical protein HYG77_38015 [Rhodococcus sp. ZPP]